MEIQEYIAKRRKELSLSQDQLAASLGYTPTAISKIESAASFPPISILPSLANALCLTLDDLLLKEEHPGPFLEPNPPYDSEKIASNLRALRLSLHLRQNEAGAKFGVNKRTIVTYEKGNACPNLEFLDKLLHVYNGKPSEFFYGTLYPEIQNSPSFRKRGPSPFFSLVLGFVLGAGLLGAILGPIAANKKSSSSSSSSNTNSGFTMNSSSGDSSSSSSSSSGTAISGMEVLTVISENGSASETTMKPNSSLKVMAYTGRYYSEADRAKTHFIFGLRYANTSLVSLDSTIDDTHPYQIVTVGNMNVTIPSFERNFQVTLKAYRDTNASVVVDGFELAIQVNP